MSSLQRAANQEDYVKKAIVTMNLAVTDVDRAIGFLNGHAAVAAAPAPLVAKPDFTPPPKPAPNRNMMLEIALHQLEMAFDALASAPGGDLGGFRAKANADIGAAAQELIAGIKKSNAAFEKGRGRGRGAGGSVELPAAPG